MPSSPSRFKLSFPNGLSAQAAYVSGRGCLPDALEKLGLRKSRPVLVVVGGASHLSRADYDRLTSLFTGFLAPLAEELGVTVIDGGTNAGVMQLMGLARTACRASFPLVGVAPLGKICLPSQVSLFGAHELEPHHSHFLLVPGRQWGDESPWMATAAGLLAAGAPSLTLLVNGGNIALVDLRESIANERPVLVMTGTGRLADEIETALRHPETEMRAGLSLVVQSNLVELSKSTAQLRHSLCNHFQTAAKLSSSRLPNQPSSTQPLIKPA
jgi:SLOG in TRPM, prokaryote